MTLLISLLITGAVLYLLYRWFKFTPEFGEQYMLTFFENPMFVIRLSGNGPWYTRLPLYFLFGPFQIKKFTYEWVDKMTYKEYSEKQELYKNKAGYTIKLEWQPNLKDEELDEKNGEFIPKNSSTKVLVSRKEPMISLKDLEGFTLAAEFETKDNFRGYRIFTLFLSVDDLPQAISKVRGWQEAAAIKFKSEYNAWSKDHTYTELRKTTIHELMRNLGVSTEKSFIDEINEQITGRDLGFTLSSVEGGEIFLNPESRDLLEEQEAPVKAEYQQKTAEIQAKTAVTKAEGEAAALKKVEEVKTAVIKERTSIGVSAFKDMTPLLVQQNKSKFGEKGLSGMAGVYVEGGSSSESFNSQKFIETVLAVKVGEKQKNGGTNEEK